MVVKKGKISLKFNGGGIHQFDQDCVMIQTEVTNLVKTKCHL